MSFEDKESCSSSRLETEYILSPEDLALEQTVAFLDERQTSIRLNPAKCKTLALEDICTNGLRMLGTCVRTHSTRERFLLEKTYYEAATVAKFINLPLQHPLFALRVCVQQILRHLQHSLKSDDLVHRWDKLMPSYGMQSPGSEVSHARYAAVVLLKTSAKDPSA